eukprot:419139-Rhodomonas_salina.1
MASRKRSTAYVSSAHSAAQSVCETGRRGCVEAGEGRGAHPRLALEGVDVLREAPLQQPCPAPPSQRPPPRSAGPERTHLCRAACARSGASASACAAAAGKQGQHRAWRAAARRELPVPGTAPWPACRTAEGCHTWERHRVSARHRIAMCRTIKGLLQPRARRAKVWDAS